MQCRLSAILAADMVGFSRLMGVDEAGTHTAVKTIRSELMAIDPDDPLTLYNVACGYTKLGDLDLACDLLERAIRTNGRELANWAQHDSDPDGLRSHPR